MLKILSVLVCVSLCSCETRTEVVVKEVEVKTITYNKPASDTEKYTKEFFQSQFTIIKSEETLKNAKEVTDPKEIKRLKELLRVEAPSNP